MRLLLVVAAALLVAGAASAIEQPVRVTPNTGIRLIYYRAHDGQIRPAWLFLPAGYPGSAFPFHGEWSHTAEMRWNRRLPRALARFGLLPWRDAPAVPATRARLA